MELYIRISRNYIEEHTMHGSLKLSAFAGLAAAAMVLPASVLAQNDPPNDNTFV